MAVALSLSQISLSPFSSSSSSSSSTYPNSPKLPHKNITFPFKFQPTSKKLITFTPFETVARLSCSRHRITKATQESTESDTTSEAETPSEPQRNGGTVSESKEDEASKLGAEIKAAMKERGEKEQDLSLNGVAEEIREIEWPAFDKVLGTTWVVLGIIAGSSVVLLTVNAILAELSDRVFAGKGVQDFFS